MSKWINKDLFNDFRKEKVEEKDTSSGFRRLDVLWDTPEKGTVENAKIYEGRFLPPLNPDDRSFYRKYHYHMWQSGDNWIFILCPKTFSTPDTWSQVYCPICSAVSKLYNGTKQDKVQAYNLKRKEKFVGNFFIVKDPRDGDREEEKKVEGKVKLYEFPSKIEQILKREITDKDGYGYEIFDPSEDGRNFIIRVLSTKKQEDGRTWPDYSQSGFARKQSAIASSEDSIDAIMETRVDLQEYIKGMEVAPDKIVEILKNEFIWDIVKDECSKFGYKDGGSTKVEKKEEKKAEKVEEDTPPWEEPKEEKKVEKKEEPKEEPKKSNDDMNDDDLLAELDNM